MADEWLSDVEWERVVRSVPIVSVDLVAVHDGGVVLGRRTNDPAKGTWFVPGGRVRKGESFKAAVHRVAAKELGVEVEIESRIGTYQHFYDVSDVPETGKHYVATGFFVTPLSTDFDPDNQHDCLRTFHSVPDGTHEYTKAYLEDGGVL